MNQGRGRRHSALWSPHFILAVAILAATGLVGGPVAELLGLYRVKRPLPLKAPLDHLDIGALGPYRWWRQRDADGRLAPDGRKVLDAVVVDALGTETYILWSLEDTSRSERDPLRYASLFVTYYTGPYHLVPHTPDVCMLGSGYEPAQPHENVELDVPLSGTSRTMTVPVRVGTFRATSLSRRTELSVVYTFHTNGVFENTGNGVRMRVSTPTNRHAYFSKVEVSFPKGATRAQALEGAARLFGYVLPELMEHHWPDFEAAERGSAAD